jgi:hypothetical protein
MTVGLIHPSRGRAKKSYANVMNWIRKAGPRQLQLVDIHVYLSIDESDPEKEEYIRLYGDDQVWYERSVFFSLLVSNNTSVVEATNVAARIASCDILIYLSDDFDCPDNWFVKVVSEFDTNKPMLLKVDDDLQAFDAPVLTIPIMNYELYKKLGYFWHPEYKSMFVDQDLYETAKRIGAIKYTPHLVFPHNHPCAGKGADDEIYQRSAANWDQGKAVFAKRKLENFPI